MLGRNNYGILQSYPSFPNTRPKSLEWVLSFSRPQWINKSKYVWIWMYEETIRCWPPPSCNPPHSWSCCTWAARVINHGKFCVSVWYDITVELSQRYSIFDNRNVRVDYADTRISNFGIEYHHENEKFAQLFKTKEDCATNWGKNPLTLLHSTKYIFLKTETHPLASVMPSEFCMRL